MNPIIWATLDQLLGVPSNDGVCIIIGNIATVAGALSMSNALWKGDQLKNAIAYI